MHRPPAFQFYAKDWLSSKKIVTMTLEEEGAYIHLLAHCWDSPDCTLPDDDTDLAQLSRMGERWFNGGSTTLRKCFEAHPKKSGRLFNARLLEERKKQEAWRRKSQEGGKRSAKSRALLAKEKSTVVEGCLKRGSAVVEPQANSSSSSSLKEIKEETTLLANSRSAEKLRPRKVPVLVPLPEEFTISNDLWDWTVKKNLSREFVEREFGRFCDHNRAHAGKFADWDAAFRNWLLKAEEFAVARNGHYPQRTDGDPAQNQERIPL